ncbi:MULTISPECIES: FKBP-type peptidyl-prolyl cis-trans isomerase [Methylobacterium]|uniref:FKBP-type peptidyl-prolyl cis-trans isomerase n=1 Tax=Methylobacterium TaxID=407 RepID=UPI0010430DF5|nr:MULTISPECIES: FKBP-type peptidyl-prolyl cis-trans isomerase [Methylobacterium]MDR7038718.1 peptidylprolyl isomerase [Methylobacterium sp. BE186]
MPRSILNLAGAALIAMTTAANAAEYVTTPQGLKYKDEVVGTGPEPKAGQQVTVQYTGWLDENGRKGKKFDSSRDRNQPFTFTLGAGQVIQGWDLGVATMKTGGRRTLVIPADLGYGGRGAGGVIPPYATLIFDVELLGAK